MRGPQAALEFAGDHSRFHLLARERLQRPDILLRPRTEFRSLLRHRCSPCLIVANESSAIERRKFKRLRHQTKGARDWFAQLLQKFVLDHFLEVAVLY
jgi:hypothetical protein